MKEIDSIKLKIAKKQYEISKLQIKLDSLEKQSTQKEPAIGFNVEGVEED